MSLNASKLLDGGVLVGAATAALYFLGVADQQGAAAALDLPASLLRTDAASTIASGGRGLQSLVMFPAFLLSDGEKQWGILAILLVTIAPALLLLLPNRLKPFRPWVLLSVGVCVVFILVWFVSMTHASGYLQSAKKCMSGGPCAEDDTKLTLHLDGGANGVLVRKGILLRTTDHFWILHGISGVLVAPVGSFKLVESAPELAESSPK